MIDKAALVAHIRAKAAWSNLRIHAALSALATAIERGDFDGKDEDDSERSYETREVFHRPVGVDPFAPEPLNQEGRTADGLVQD